MDSFDTTNVLIKRINTLDPKNASKITGYLLIQDLEEQELRRLACGPDTLLHSVIIRARDHLGLSSNTFCSSSTSPVNAVTKPSVQIPFSPLPPPSPSNPCTSKNANFSPKSSPFLSFDNVRCGSPLVSPSSVVDGGGGSAVNELNNGGDLGDGFPLNEYLSFLNEPTPQNDVQFGGGGFNGGDSHLHRRSFSASDVCFGSEDEVLVGIGFRPCQYYARGFCKNGDSCKFAHVGFPGNENDGFVDSPRKMEGIYLQHEDMIRMKAAAHQRRMAAAQLMAGGISPMGYNKSMNLLMQHQNGIRRQLPPEMMMEEFYKQCSCRPDMNNGLNHHAARQIYLTFPADSTFSDEDVSNYFSTFGPVHDVRIPHQQNRMFGFVTFHHADTVKLILARGNPHFISDSRVLVKPYKEKGKLSDKRHQHMQQMLTEMGNFSPAELDCRDPYELHLGPKMPCNASEVMLRRRLEEQADLQHSIELHRRRLMSLQLPNLKHNMAHHHHNRSLSIGSPGSLPSHLLINQNGALPPHHVFNQNATLGSPVSFVPSMAAEERSKDELPAVCAENCDSNNSEDLTLKTEGFDHHDLRESCVDENLFAGDSTNSTEASITNSTEASITNCSKASESNA